VNDSLKNKITARAETDADFKAALDSDPVAALRGAFGDELSLEDLDAISAGNIGTTVGNLTYGKLARNSDPS